METPLSLLTPPDPALLVAQAASLLPTPDWRVTTDWLQHLGITTEVAVGEGVAVNALTHCRSFALADGGARLEVEVSATFASTLCARRFGGRPAAPGRSSAVEAALARDLIERIVIDLISVGRAWESTGPARDEGPAVVRTLTFAAIEGGPHGLLRLSGALLGVRREVTVADDWAERLAAVAREVRLPVRGVLARPLLSAGEVARLSVGAVIPIRAPDRVTLLSGRHRLGTGALTEIDGHAAIALDPDLECLT